MRTNKPRTKSHLRWRAPRLVKRAVADAVPSARTQVIATHEAAHCVAARRLQLPRCGGASIVEPDAHAVFPCNHGPESIVALMAGAASEVIAFGRYDEIGVRTDLEQWTRRLELYGYEDST